MDGSVDFYLGWDNYTLGFGDLNGEFWLGKAVHICFLISLVNNIAILFKVDIDEQRCIQTRGQRNIHIAFKISDIRKT